MTLIMAKAPSFSLLGTPAASPVLGTLTERNGWQPSYRNWIFPVNRYSTSAPTEPLNMVRLNTTAKLTKKGRALRFAPMRR